MTEVGRNILEGPPGLRGRVIKVWENHGRKDLADAWRMLDYEEYPLMRRGHSNEWSYYDWAGARVHHNIDTDRVIVFFENDPATIWGEPKE